MPEIHLIGFGNKTRTMEKKVRNFLLRELPNNPRGSECCNEILKGAVLVGHPDTTARNLKDGKKAPYILVQSTDENETGMLGIILMDLKPRVGVVEGAQLLGFISAKEDDSDSFPG